MHKNTIFTGIIADNRDRQITSGAGIDMQRVVSRYPRVYAKPSLRLWHLSHERALRPERMSSGRAASVGLAEAAAIAC